MSYKGYLCFGEAETGGKVLAFLTDDVLVAVESFLESDELGRRKRGANALRFAIVKTRKCGRLAGCLGTYPCVYTDTRLTASFPGQPG